MNIQIYFKGHIYIYHKFVNEKTYNTIKSKGTIGNFMTFLLK